MKRLIKLQCIFALFICLVSCSKDPGGNDTPVPPNPTPTPTPGPEPTQMIEIKINPTLTRATDYGFEQNDRIGLYVVNYNGTAAGTLLNTGNHVDNMRFTYSGVWTPDTQIFWKDETTHADFYMYYPYNAVSDISAVPFEVKADQSSDANYKASDFLYGKATDIVPTSSAITINAQHVMSRISITLEAGNGFTKESLEKANVGVKINGIRTSAIIDLKTGAISANGELKNITPKLDNGIYRALIIPQTVEEGNLITVTVDDREYNLKKGFSFESGKSHDFIVTISKTSNGINVNINPWNEDGTDNGGIAE